MLVPYSWINQSSVVYLFYLHLGQCWGKCLSNMWDFQVNRGMAIKYKVRMFTRSCSKILTEKNIEAKNNYPLVNKPPNGTSRIQKNHDSSSRNGGISHYQESPNKNNKYFSSNYSAISTKRNVHQPDLKCGVFFIRPKYQPSYATW